MTVMVAVHRLCMLGVRYAFFLMMSLNLDLRPELKIGTHFTSALGNIRASCFSVPYRTDRQLDVDRHAMWPTGQTCIVVYDAP